VGSLKPEIVTGELLYTRLGGITGIATVVNHFLDAVLADPTITANEHVRHAVEKASLPAFKYLVIELVASACGGPQKYSGRTMKESHKHLKITEKEWEVFAGLFKKSLDHFNVPATEQNELFAIVGSLKADIVDSGITPKITLYDRLGGWNGIATVSDDFVDKIKTDYILNENPYIREANKNSIGPAFKFLVTELVCQATGGPQKYTGKGMRESHAGMKITEKEWQQFVALFKQSLDKFRVPVAEQSELVAIVATLKNDVVTVSGLVDVATELAALEGGAGSTNKSSVTGAYVERQRQLQQANTADIRALNDLLRSGDTQ